MFPHASSVLLSGFRMVGRRWVSQHVTVEPRGLSNRIPSRHQGVRRHVMELQKRGFAAASLT